MSSAARQCLPARKAIAQLSASGAEAFSAADVSRISLLPEGQALAQLHRLVRCGDLHAELVLRSRRTGAALSCHQAGSPVPVGELIAPDGEPPFLAGPEDFQARFRPTRRLLSSLLALGAA